MVPFIVNPKTYEKEAAFSDAVIYVNEFLTMNGLSMPSKLITRVDEQEKYNNVWRDKGWYRFDTMTMFVNVKRSKVPVKTPGFQWSYTGFKADLTAPGVLAHETGHHIHNMLNDKLGKMAIIRMINNVIDREISVSGYEPNAYESFAEAMRLFIMNPELLRTGRPARWNLIVDDMGLKPPHDASWRDVLINAHPKIINAAQKWIDNAL